MKPLIALSLHRAQIRDIVQRHRASNPRVFGSVTRGEDTQASDLDLLVDPDAGMTLFDIARSCTSCRKHLV